ncbi:MAG TPA: IPT/TIG domain-containing protein, partial [Armatimonadota bacterium]|nr:IPT/TIG domain-containing protein [Armatimonadota bacterium]
MRAKYPLAGTWILLAALSLAGLGHASVVRPYTDVELATLAESVLVGTVADIASRSSAGGQSIETEIAIRVVLPIKGCRQGDVIRLTMPGGTVGTMTQWVSGVPAFRIGEDALLHVERLRSGELGVLGWRRGKSAVTSGRIAASGAPLAEAVDSIRGLVGAKAVPISTIDLDAASHLFPDSPAVAPSIANISPASASGNTGTVITIAGTDFGSSQGTVTFPWAGTSNQADIVSWSSTQIKCRVPQAESGAVTVRTSGAAASNPYSYQITFCALDFKLPESAMPDKFTCHSAGTPDATNEFAEIEAAFSNWTGTPNTLIDALGLPNVGTP